MRARVTLKKSSTQELGFTKTDETEGFPPAFPLNYFPPQRGKPERSPSGRVFGFPLNVFFPPQYTGAGAVLEIHEDF